MGAAWILGLSMAWLGDLWSQHWFQAKLLLLVFMQIVHAFYAHWRRHFEADANRRPARFYRIANEATTVLMILIVVAAVVKPF